MNVSARVSSIVNLRLGLVDDNFEVAAVLVFIADAFGIFIQLGGVVGACEEIFQENRMRNGDGPQVLIAAGGICRISVRIVENCRPCSASSPLTATSAFLTFVGSY